MDSSRKYLHSTHVTTTVGSSQVFKLHPNAELPQHFAEDEQIGYFWDVHAHARDENRNDDLTGEMNVFCTGFAVLPPAGFHFEFAPHPDLWRSGYMMANNPIVYSSAEPDDEVKIVLYKFKDGDDLDLPHPVARMFIRENYTTQLNVVRASKTVAQPVKKRTAAPEEYDYGPAVVPINTRKNKGYSGGLA